MKKGTFALGDRLKSFKYAFSGLRILAVHHNARIQIAAAVIVIIMSWIYGISNTEWCLVLLCIGLVLALEGFNSSVEYLADVVSPDFDHRIKQAKDVAAGAVLIVAIISLIIGLIIFIPKI